MGQQRWCHYGKYEPDYYFSTFHSEVHPHLGRADVLKNDVGHTFKGRLPPT